MNFGRKWLIRDPPPTPPRDRKDLQRITRSCSLLPLTLNSLSLSPRSRVHSLNGLCRVLEPSATHGIRCAQSSWALPVNHSGGGTELQAPPVGTELSTWVLTHHGEQALPSTHTHFTPNPALQQNHTLPLLENLDTEILCQVIFG